VRSPCPARRFRRRAWGGLARAWVSDLNAFFKYILPLMVVVTLSSCSPVVRPNLNSADPQARINAIVQVANARDPQAVPLLVGLLDDDDGAVRFYAVLALEKITGTRRGYDYAAPAWRRAVAVQRWRDWLEQEATPVGLDERSAEAGGKAGPQG
jgi:hypothetical protein